MAKRHPINEAIADVFGWVLLIICMGGLAVAVVVTLWNTIN